MKVVLVNVLAKGDRLTNQGFEPLGLAYLSSYAKRVFPGLQVTLLSTDDPGEVFRDSPDLVGISSVSHLYHLAERLAGEAAARKVPVLVGGAHVTLLPASLPRGAVGVLGEGEETFVALLRLLEAAGSFPPASLREVQGIAFHDEAGNLVRTERRPHIKPIDPIPFPDRDLLDIERRGTVYLFSSRGCPYTCTFCASTRIFPGLRFFSAGYVVDEIQHLVDRYQPRLIKFYDDLFIASRPRLREIVAKIRERGIHRKVLFSINSTASLIDEEVAHLLRKMNVFTVGMGLESGNQESLDYLKAGKATVAQNEKAIELLVRAGINPTATFIIGSPGEDLRRFQDTLDFIGRSRLSNFYLYLLTPFPGTPVWELAKEKGLVSDQMDWELLNVNENADLSRRILLNDAMSVPELLDCFARFEALRRRKRRTRLIAQGLRRPDLILPYLWLRLKGAKTP